MQTKIASVQFSHSVVSDSLRPHESQHARLPCPSPTPGVHSDSRPLSQWYHPAISSSVIPFSSCPQSLPASEFFPMSQLFTWVRQAKVLAFQLQHHSLQRNPKADLLQWTGWISLQSKGVSRVFSNTTVQKHQFFGTQLSSQSNSHIHTWPLDIPFIKRSYIAPCFRAWIRGQVAWVGRITKSKLDASHQCTVKPIYWCRVVVKESIVFMYGI